MSLFPLDLLKQMWTLLVYLKSEGHSWSNVPGLQATHRHITQHAHKPTWFIHVVLSFPYCPWPNSALLTAVPPTEHTNRLCWAFHFPPSTVTISSRCHLIYQFHWLRWAQLLHPPATAHRACHTPHWHQPKYHSASSQMIPFSWRLMSLLPPPQSPLGTASSSVGIVDTSTDTWILKPLWCEHCWLLVPSLLFIHAYKSFPLHMAMRGWIANEIQELAICKIKLGMHEFPPKGLRIRSEG